MQDKKGKYKETKIIVEIKVVLPKPAKNAQFDSKKSSLLSRVTPEKFHLYLTETLIVRTKLMQRKFNQ